MSTTPETGLEPKYRALLNYAMKVTLTPAACTENDVVALRSVTASDVEIHATVQVAAYFNYINRIADGLGVDLEPEMKPG